VTVFTSGTASQYHGVSDCSWEHVGLLRGHWYIFLGLVTWGQIHFVWCSGLQTWGRFEASSPWPRSCYIRLAHWSSNDGSNRCGRFPHTREDIKLGQSERSLARPCMA